MEKSYQASQQCGAATLRLCATSVQSCSSWSILATMWKKINVSLSAVQACAFRGLQTL